MKLAIIVYSNEPETILNALELSHYALEDHDEVRVFLLGEGIGAGAHDYAKEPYSIIDEMKKFVDNGGQLFASSKHLGAREPGYAELCMPSSMSEVYKMIKESDTVVTF